MEKLFEGCTPVTLNEMLEEREKRMLLQQKLLAAYRQTLICYTMIIPGEYKWFPLAAQAFHEGKRQIMRQLERDAMTLLHCEEEEASTGCQCLMVVAAEATLVKQGMMNIEENHPLGRIFDLDVIDATGLAIHRTDFGRGERDCLLCGQPVWVCSRSRTHPLPALVERITTRIKTYFCDQYADEMARQAVRALLYEVCVTPKPGLVDRMNNGSHSDMNCFTFVDSATALFTYFRRIVHNSLYFTGAPEDLLDYLRPLGREAEDTMREATKGVNTHKGAIFALGIVCAARGYLHGNHLSEGLDELLDLCSRMTDVPQPYRATGGQCSHGEAVLTTHGWEGARGEAAQGFPSVRLYGLPTLRQWLCRGESANDAGVAALLHLMARVDDTNMAYRVGVAALRRQQARLQDFLQQTPDKDMLLHFAKQLDHEFMEHNMSPGGCADLLAVSYLLYFCFFDSCTCTN